MIGNGIDFAAKFGRAGGPRRTKTTQANQGLALETAPKTAHWKSMGYKAVCKSIAAAHL